jgi:hypothetical protein
VTFRTRISPPITPGEYILELGLLSELVTWFSAQGVEPVKIPVRVMHSKRDTFEQVLTTQVKVIDNPPKLEVTTDRPRYRHGDRLHLIINGIAPDRTHNLDVYFVLAWPDGRIFFRDHNGLLRESEGPWIPVAKGLMIAKGTPYTNQSLIDLNFVDMPHGSYICYLILTKPNTYDIISKTEALFTLEP